MIKIITRENPGWANQGIWIIKRDEIAKKSWVCNPTELIFKEVDDRAFLLPEPTFKFPYHEAKEFLTAFAQGLSEAGFDASDKRVYGERDAMAKHLADLQKYIDKLLK